MKYLIRFLNLIVLLSVSVLIGAFFYHGMGGVKISEVISVSVTVMDISFILSTICNLIYFRKHKTIMGFSVFSLILILIALIMKGLSITYPLWGLLIWDFYLLYFYSYLVWKGVLDETKCCNS